MCIPIQLQLLDLDDISLCADRSFDGVQNCLQTHPLVVVSGRLVGVLKVVLGGTDLGDDGGRALGPACGADLAVLGDKLEGLDETEGLVDRAADGEVVDRHLLHNTLGVDDKQTTQSNALVLKEHAVVGRDLLGDVGNDRDLHLPKSALLPGRVHPSKVGDCMRVSVGRGRGGGGEGEGKGRGKDWTYTRNRQRQQQPRSRWP